MPRSQRKSELDVLHDEIRACRKCPRLVAWRETVAREKRRMFRDETYWGRPVPGFGDPKATLLVLGLAPAAHGANRTGRAFTGDRSGDFLFAALHRAGLANQAECTGRDDGLTLRGVFVSISARCAPPDNLPDATELGRCAPFLDREIALLPNLRVVLALGAIAWNAYLDHLGRRGVDLPHPRPKFAHAAELLMTSRPRMPHVIGSYHVSQQNTQTGRLTPAMFDAMLDRAHQLAADG